MVDGLLRRCRPALGTYVEIGIASVATSKRVEATHALEHAFSAIALVQRCMSFHDPASDLSRINAAAPGAVLQVHPWTAEVLLLAQDLHQATNGGFDCGVGAILRDWGLLPQLPQQPGERRPETSPAGSALDIEVSANPPRVRILKAVCLDLGGIAKGFAVDRAVDALAAAGVSSAVVNAGGDLRVLGDVARPLHVRLPQAPKQLVFLGDLAAGAAATSARYFSELPGRPDRCALVNPATRSAVPDRRSFTVLAPLCAVADGLTKALAVAGALGESCLARFGARTIVV